MIYIEDFYTRSEADAFLEFIKTLPHVRPENKRNNKSLLRRLSFPGYSPSPNDCRTAARYHICGPVLNAPQLYQELSSRLTAFGGKDVNYLSTVGYLADDHMNFHQHAEDMKREDQTVYVLSLGAVHPVAIRYGATVGKKFVPDGRQEIFYPAHGSLYVLPSAFNVPGSGQEAQHAVLEGNDYSHNGLRISINAKHIPAGLSPEAMKKACSRPAGNPNVFVRKPGPPRIYSQRKGKKYPPDAVNVDRDTIFGNHQRLDMHNAGDRLLWAEDVRIRMLSPEFRAQVEAMRGKDLLCWCNPKQIKNGWCHALTWLRLANEGDG